MPGTVVDASVVAAWAFGEPRAGEAALVVQRPDCYAPSLLAHELASIARTKAVRGPDKVNEIIRSLNATLGLQIHWRTVDYAAVVRLAIETGLSVYDASYLLIARELRIGLATFDDRRLRVAKDSHRSPAWGLASAAVDPLFLRCGISIRSTPPSSSRCR